MSAFDENPFADPSVVRAVGDGNSNITTNTANSASLEDYNPFDRGTTTLNSGGPAVMNPSSQAPPTYTPNDQQQISTSDFQRRQEELERKIRDVERREEELQNNPYNQRENNWPPLPRFCPAQPCFYHEISVDIPVEFQKIVTDLYKLWIAHVCVLFANLIVSLFYLFVGGDKGATFGVALIYTFLFTPASFICWYRPAYKAFRDDSSFNFLVFFFVFFFQFIFSVIYTLGIEGVGSCGLIMAIAELSTATGSGIFVGSCMLLVALGFGLTALGDFYMLVKINKLYRKSNASIAKAQAEFTSGVMRNEQVQAAASSVARETIRSQFAGGASTSNNAPPPRY